uniref:Disease resistance R13L4/SHOC-2-like LRR domain-containing protein n=1 Tax=Chenopodium quinoa TaxID=63459 RepID=A0A803MN67_CHEQI
MSKAFDSQGCTKHCHSPSVRSILSFVRLEKFPISWSSPFQEAEFRLKVLDLQNAKFSNVPEVLGKLHNLRYLCMRNTKVKKLPESIGGLWNLQTLDLKKTDVVELPKGINRLQKLRHLLVCNYKDEKMVPVRIHEGVLNNFKELQKLAFVDGSSPTLVPGLDTLKRLRRLAIENLRPEHGKTLCEALQNMTQLRSLSVSSIEIIDDVQVNDENVLNLSHLISPPEFLERLYLKGPLVGKELPKWVHKLKHLVRLRLINSGFMNDPLEKLKVMQELLVLELDNAYDGKVLDFGYKGLKKLVVLRIIRLRRLKTLKAGENALPKLNVAEYHTCYNLEDIPPQILKASDTLLNTRVMSRTKSSKF